jgi:peptidoglycan/xylan/chitin deacetylase (PgdA/CDA1 family)
MLWLSDAAARAAWDRACLQVNPHSRRVWRRLQLAWAAARADHAQRRLDRRLRSGPRAENLPWIWLPGPRAAIAMALALAAWGLVGDPAPATRTLAPATGSVAVGPPPGSTVEDRAPQPLPAPPPEAPSPSRRIERPRPAPRRSAEDVVRGNPRVPAIAFTFDGGDDANVAAEILDSLGARGVRSTMFLTGQFIRRHPDLVRRMVTEGHEVGNHLDTHPHLTTYAQDRRQRTLPGVTREFVHGHLRRVDDGFHGLTGQRLAPFWRAPFGEHNDEIRGWAAEIGYRHISWTRGAGVAEDLDTRDWVADRSSRIYRSRAEIVDRLLAFGQGRPEGLNGGIVLMHLGTNRRTDRPHEALPKILATLQGRGYRLVNVSELLRHEDTGAPAQAPLPVDGPAAVR